MIKKPVNEIFYSLQGEGFYAGRSAIFIRFSGCNLSCPFCDTDHRKFTLMTDNEIQHAICNYPSDFVVLTGGEPALYVDIDFVEMLHKIGKYVAIETNGTHTLPENIDWITLSPKNDFCEDAQVVIRKADELKMVFLGQDLKKHLEEPLATYHFLQPCDMGDKTKNKKNLQDCINYCMKHPEWRLSLQLHKLIGFQ